jgi:hypothetical protein
MIGGHFCKNEKKKKILKGYTKSKVWGFDGSRGLVTSSYGTILHPVGVGVLNCHKRSDSNFKEIS